MPKQLKISHNIFKKKMDDIFDEKQDITSLDVFDTFVKALQAETNLLNEEDLKALVFKQFKEYGDFDKTMNEVAQSVSDITRSTDEAISAIDRNDSSALKSAYSQLKNYQKRIFSLEEDMYTDDTTGIKNRKYLYNRELDTNRTFKTDGLLMHMNISNFTQINKEHGYEAGDIVLKFVSKMLQKELKTAKVTLIRYVGVQLIVITNKSLSDKADKIFSKAVSVILSKKFKTHSGEVLNIELEYNKVSYAKGQSFQDVYQTL